MKRQDILGVATLSVIFALVYCSPWIVFGENSYVRIHDGLDSLIGWHTVMSHEGLWFALNEAPVVPMHVGGAPRVSLPSELSLTTALFAILDPYQAYVAQQIIIRILAFTGIALLTLEVVPPKHTARLWLAIAGGLCYASVPFWGWTGASAGAGWVAYSVLRLWKGRTPLLSYLALALYPFMSSIVLTGVFVVGSLWVFAAWSAWIRYRRKQMFTAALITTLAHIIADYRLFLFLFNPIFVPHRIEFVIGHTDLSGSISAFLGDLLGTAPGIQSLQSPITIRLILLALLVACTTALLKTLAPNSTTSRKIIGYIFVEKDLWVAFFVTVAAIFLISTTYAFWEWSGSQIVRENIPILNMVNMSRGIYFHPLLWSFAFVLFLALLTVRMNKSFAYVIIGVMTLIQLRIAASSHEYIVERRQSGITYSQFIATELFSQITDKLSMDRTNVTVASIGIHPSVLHVNHFHTADAYLGLYPLEYKHKFRELVYPEFSRNQDLLSYFDGWGSRAYIFSAEMMCPRNGAVCTADDGSRIERLAIEGRALAEFGIDYLFASTPIGNSSEIGLTDLGTFRHPDSAWAITVYRTQPY